MPTGGRNRARTSAPSDPLWYKDAVLYELRVGTFQDSDGDGIGDFPGLSSRLDYLQDLGVTTLWLLPFYPSPLRDDGYDIADFLSVHPAYGTLDDFRSFLDEAHERGLRVVTELIINHTSDQHPWFQRARRAPPLSEWRDFYVWSDSAERYKEARIIFQDFEQSNWTWDPVAGAYYWHRFYAHQPDLNFASPAVHQEILQILEFWLDLGVDGMRLDAIPYLYEREGTSCENLAETHAFLVELRRHLDQKYDDRMLLAEANQWPEDAVAYFGKGDECHMSFHFPIMPRLYLALHREDRYPIQDILAQTPAIPEACQWALFLRNHDELTLEMVTDEERDSMIRAYAPDPEMRINLGIRRRLAPLLGNDRRRIELLNALLFSLPGTPVVYYGDEIGMGDNVQLSDRNGVRTPMQWSAERNAGFSRADPERLSRPVIVDPEYHYEGRNVADQQDNPGSLLHWMKRLIAVRKRHPCFGRGTIDFLSPANQKVLAFLRRHGEETVLVVANLSRSAEFVELDLSAYRGMIATEMLSGRPFPTLGERHYLLTLGAHSFYWLSLARPDAPAETDRPTTPPIYRRRELETPAPATSPVPSTLSAQGAWDAVLQGEREALESALARWLVTQRWFAGKARELQGVSIQDAIGIPTDAGRTQLLLVETDQDGQKDIYAVPLAFAATKHAAELRAGRPQAIVAELALDEDGSRATGVLFDALEEPAFAKALLEAIARRGSFRGERWEVVGEPGTRFAELGGSTEAPLSASLLRVEQSNSAIAFGDRLMLKLERKLSEGVNAELEMGRFLTESADFPHVAPLAGSLEVRIDQAPPATLAILQGFVAHQASGWSHALDHLGEYFGRALSRSVGAIDAPLQGESLAALLDDEPPPLVEGMLGAYIETVRLLGQRTAELHWALGSDAAHPEWQPVPFTSLHQRALEQSMRNLANRAFRLLRGHLPALPAHLSLRAKQLLDSQPRVLEAFRRLGELRISTQRIRHHGDYHLGQVLFTGKDFVLIDFGGEPARSPAERRAKRSALVDVAGMLRSFDYAVHAGLRAAGSSGAVRPADLQALAPWARFWRRWVSAAFLQSYLQHSEGAPFVPSTRDELTTLLGVHVLEKSVYELAYELDNRQDWLEIPMQGILRLVDELVS